MKAVSNLVATIILLSITMVLVGVTALYFSNTTKTVQSQIQQQEEIGQDVQGKTIRIRDVVNKSLYVKNTGSRNISLAEINVYLNNVNVNCAWNESIISVGSTAKCTMPDYCLTNQLLRVTAPGNFDGIVCELHRVQLVKRFNATEDTHIIGEGSIDYSNNNYGASPAVYIGKRSKYEISEALLRFEHIVLPPNSTILQATLNVYVTGADSTTSANFSVYRLLQNWGEGNKAGGVATDNEASWNSYRYNCNACANNGLWNSPGANASSDTEPEDGFADRSQTAESTAIINGVNATFSWIVTDAVVNWLSEDWTQNYGLIIIATNRYAQNTRKWFDSNESSAKPYIEVTYETL